MHHARSLVIGIAFILAACAPGDQQPPQSGGITLGVPFSVDEVAWSRGKGPNRIIGSMVDRARDGGARTCTAYGVQAVPDSPAARERLAHLYGALDKGFRPASTPAVCMAPTYPGYRETQRTAACDMDGNFAFDALPDGVWYIITSAVWQGKEGEHFEGGTYMRRVEVHGGATAFARMK